MNINESQSVGPRDVFMQLLITIGLYAIIISFTALVFGIINIYVPDKLGISYFSRGALRFPIAALIVIFPVYLWLARMVQKEVIVNPEKRAMRIRKWLLYFTLSAAGVVVVGDLISVIYKYLDGDVTARFILKVLTVFVVAGAVFIYYNWNLRKNEVASSHPIMRIFVFAVTIIVASAVIVGLIAAGSPKTERLRQLDTTRVYHLQDIQSQVIDYWQGKGELPEKSSDLEDPIVGFVLPIDPETEQAYGYSIINEFTFEICATFALTSEENEINPYSYRYPYGGEENWKHETGKMCFERTIDEGRLPKTPAPLIVR